MFFLCQPAGLRALLNKYLLPDAKEVDIKIKKFKFGSVKGKGVMGTYDLDRF